MPDIALALLVGVGIGIVVGALGAGGGILTIPVLVFLLGHDPHDAAAGSLVVVALTAIASIIAHARHGTVRWREGFLFAAACLAGSVFGSRLSVRVDGDLLLVLFAVLLAAVAALMFYRAWSDGDDLPTSPSNPTPSGLVLFTAATLTGFLTGFFGVGGGFAVVPMLVMVLGFRIREAAGTSLLVIIIVSLTGLISRIGTDVTIDWPIILTFAAASMVGGLLGEPLSNRVKDRILTFSFAVLLAVVAVVTAIQAVPNL